MTAHPVLHYTIYDPASLEIGSFPGSCVEEHGNEASLLHSFKPNYSCKNIYAMCDNTTFVLVRRSLHLSLNTLKTGSHRTPLNL